MSDATTHDLDALLARFGGFLRQGKHDPDSRACIMEARSVYLGEPWSDHPAETTSMARARGAWARRINDAAWSSDQARTDALWPTVSMDDPAPGWLQRLAERTIRVIVPLALRAAARANPGYAGKLEEAAERCGREGNAAALTAATALAAAATALAAAAATDLAAAASSDLAAAATALAAAADLAAAATAADLANAARDKVLAIAVRIALEVWNG